MSKTPGNSGSPLCHPSAHHFYSNGDKFWHPQHTHQNIRNGSLRINGLNGNSDSNYPNHLSVVSLRTAGNVIGAGWEKIEIMVAIIIGTEKLEKS